MRRQQKVEVLEVIQSLFCAHEEIRASLQGNELEVSKNMLVQIQEYAIELGNIIDSFEGEGSVTVKYLEDYCTKIFELYNSLDEGLSANQLYKKLGKSLLKVENSLNNDIQLKKEIVFFPSHAKYTLSSKTDSPLVERVTDSTASVSAGAVSAAKLTIFIAIIIIAAKANATDLRIFLINFPPMSMYFYSI